MLTKKAGGTRNYGYGRSLRFAVQSALIDRYGSGRFGTRSTMLSRAYQFVAFLKRQEVRTFRAVDAEVIQAYAEELRNSVIAGDLSVSTAHNYLSAVNQVMATLRGDRALWQSPCEAFGERSFVRERPPKSLDSERVEAAAQQLERDGEKRVACLVRLCRALGLRHREALLLNIHKACRQAERCGEVQIHRGTKGGRTRSIEVVGDQVLLLRRIQSVVQCARNLVPIDQSRKQCSGYCYRTWSCCAPRFGLSTGFHDLRSAYACDLYTKETGLPAPVLTNGRIADGETDRLARLRIARALGHGRPQIAAAYIGTSRRAKP